MWKLLAVVVCVSAASAAPVPKDFKKQDDKALLVGTWTMTRCNVGGRDIPDPSWRTLVFDAEGGLKASLNGKPVLEYVTVLDLAATPNRMPWKNKLGGETAYECVYQLTAESLTILVPHDHKKPPTSLDIAPRVTVYEFRRGDAK